MLKKIIVGIFCFVVLAATAGGIYIYTLDWNKHKALVAERLSQITGLKASIDGNLEVKLFPSPKFSASKVKFSRSGVKSPLVVVNEIIANVDLLPLLDNNFIVKSMTLSQATAYVEINDKGVSNWDGLGTQTNNKSGNIEVSFNDIRLNGSSLNYKNLQDNSAFVIGNISASISAPALSGPYKTNGKFIHNNHEVLFGGDIAKNNNLSLKLKFANAASGSTVSLEGELGKKAKGIVTFDTQNLQDVSNIIWADKGLPDKYNKPLYVSFQYDYSDALVKLDNFTTKFDKNTVGSGTVILKKDANIPEINAAFDFSKFDLNIFEYLADDIITYTKSGKTFAQSPFAGYIFNFTAKAASALLNDIESRNLTVAFSLNDNAIDITRFGLVLPGDTVLKTVGKIKLDKDINYIFNQAIDSKDLRVFASMFNIDLAKFATPENKKSIFKRAQADINLSGNLDSIKIAIPRAIIDSTALRGNLGIVKKDTVFVLADFDLSKIIFDKYLNIVPDTLKNATLKDKFIYQMNLIPWNHDLNVSAELNINSAVYNDIPIEKLAVSFVSEKDTLNVNKLSIASFAGASVNMKLDAKDIYNDPYFNEISYDIKSSNLPMLTSTLGINTGTKSLFKRKLFAAQGALSGNFEEFSLSSVQKFGDTEFSYTGVVANNHKNPISVNGDLELKANNFSSFIKALNFNYTPDIPVTTFTLNSKVKGSVDLFSLDNINAYLGANAVKGNIQFDNTSNKPKLISSFEMDKFEADRWFNLSKNSNASSNKNANDFITRNFSDKKIDLSALDEIDFNIKANAKQLTFDRDTYTDVQTEILLKDGILNVPSFNASQNDTSIYFRFLLNSKDLHKIDGYFKVKKLKIPELGGKRYALESGWLTAEGNFSSLLSSETDFVENLNAKGKFSYANTAMRGWDLDIIKFELEQRKSIAGFEDTVLNSLRSGKSSFSKIRGSYTINKGLVVADSLIWESPVVNMNMKFNLNLSDWLFNAAFNAVYHNASFSDILKFSLDGNLANPVVKADLSESIARISEIEDKIKNARIYKEKEKRERLSGKIEALQKAVDNALQDINRLTLDVVRYKPVTQNENVVRVYDDNIKTINTAEVAIKKMKDTLNNYPEESDLNDIEANLGAEKAKLKFIPKVLEENYIVDSKYIFDETFNKIAWVYNLSQNNYAYYKSLSDVYFAQIEILKTSTTPLDDASVKKLKDGFDKAKEIMDNIASLHGKIRDNYLNIIDAVKVSQMNENNDIAKQALETMLTYSKQLYSDIVISLDNFRAALNINARDYDNYLLYPPENIADIDISKPTVKNSSTKKASEDAEPSDAKTSLEKKSDNQDALNSNLDLTLSQNSGLFAALQNFNDSKKAQNDITLVSSLAFDGISDILQNNVLADFVVENNALTEFVSEKKLALLENPSSLGLDKQISALSHAPSTSSPDEPQKIALNQDTSSNIISKTKEAINKIWKKIKQEEQNLKTSIAKEETAPKETVLANNSEKDTAPLAETVTNEDIHNKSQETVSVLAENNVPETVATNASISSPEKAPAENKTTETQATPSTLKVNPVIAMNIANKPEETKIASFDLSKRTKFIKSDDSLVPEYSDESQIDNFSQFIDDIITDKSLRIANSERVADIITSAPTVADNSAPVEQIKEITLIVASENIPEPVTPQNLYVFPKNDNLTSSVSGTVAKTMLYNHSEETSAPTENKYVFAATSPYHLNFSGSVAKRLSLSN